MNTYHVSESEACASGRGRVGEPAPVVAEVPCSAVVNPLTIMDLCVWLDAITSMHHAQRYIDKSRRERLREMELRHAELLANSARELDAGAPFAAMGWALEALALAFEMDALERAIREG